MTPPYAAPEQWRHEHATPATDVYAFGVMAYELLVGTRPFQGPTSHDYREQHLHHPAPSLTGVPSGLDALVAECLYKPPEARPRAANLVARLSTARAGEAASAGLAKLGQVNRDEVHRASAAGAEASAAQTAAEARHALQAAAADLWGRITTALADAVTQAAPAADVRRHGNGFDISLGRAKLSASVSSALQQRWDGAAFNVVATAAIDLQTNGPYSGRQHSIWYCDAQVAGGYAWFETAFMTSPLIRQRRPQEPFAMDPGPDSGHALSPAMHTVQVAWPFTPLNLGELDEFIDRWANWLADAARGALQHPSSLPERNPDGSWRQS